MNRSDGPVSSGLLNNVRKSVADHVEVLVKFGYLNENEVNEFTKLVYEAAKDVVTDLIELKDNVTASMVFIQMNRVCRDELYIWMVTRTPKPEKYRE